MPKKAKKQKVSASKRGQSAPVVPKASGPSFAESFVRVAEIPKLHDPLLVVGLPGVGFVSKLAVDHLVSTLKAKRFATLYSPYFPNQVVALASGRLRLFSMRFYFAKMKKRDFVFLKGDLQPLTIEGQYEVSAKALSFFSSLGGKEVLAMAGFAVNKQQESPSVFCTSTSKREYQKFLKLGAKKGSQTVPIVGLGGLVPGLAPIFGATGACLLVETPGNTIDARGAKALVEMLGKLAGEKFNTRHLDEHAKKAEALLKGLEQQAQQAQAEAAKAGELAAPELAKRENLTYIR
ncbi:MAG: PAC2 family protein [Candidatus Micrarchaeia archaeon]